MGKNLGNLTHHCRRHPRRHACGGACGFVCGAMEQLGRHVQLAGSMLEGLE